MTERTPIIFCDFDGTITTKDNIIAIMKEFAPPKWEPIKDDILAQRVSIKEGVGRMFDLLDTSKKQEIISFVQQSTIRDGFADFVAHTNKEDIPLHIVSGGIDFFVQPMLESYELNGNIYCNGSDFSGDTIRITWPHACDDQCDNDCGCCKPSILRTYPKNDYYRIVIGDSITDLEAAKLADHVFVCGDFLEEKCKELRLPYTRFADFRTVIHALNTLGVTS
ncbi:2-hydroxy-3-keto-5-methylthiopentenyl-1-phosphate phosphatase [Paenalkalicoccus suaedae]|uniref:2-hydroxy-3-keto-5-methylthiopentenyl-1-phosphate phosphatase n=1 Tax=Paenalkalicoccus suaedae TaxID=2592382 RepID=A0A859FB52_9BACI|nr:2-hydroxy-3-keto-5-methylthiopentenyl-1-phosphate phosphatase [Paenalkalicoccus suaedae]QKS69881.1 2-hydroxy-3-keto-5-methylthiopentenyl-1-phosphate phosphatase [Paenalkalicoccus suaedae]